MRNNQDQLRTDLYRGVVDACNSDDTATGRSVGQRFILPSSFTGSQRYMNEKFQVIHLCIDQRHKDMSSNLMGAIIVCNFVVVCPLSQKDACLRFDTQIVLVSHDVCFGEAFTVMLINPKHRHNHRCLCRMPWHAAG